MNVYDRQLMTDGRILHHLGLQLQRDAMNVATPKPVVSVCAWCDADAGIKRTMDENITHGICDRHKAQMLNPDLESQRRQAA